ncbi:hypothetical protein SELMODRAFT_72740, partial [Selaginella moellendorffii]
GCEPDKLAYNILISGFCQSGKVEKAIEVMQLMLDLEGINRMPNLYAWNSIIRGFSQNEDWKTTLELVGSMLLEGVRPSYITYMSILTACNYKGVVNSAREHFGIMVE